MLISGGEIWLFEKFRSPLELFTKLQICLIHTSQSWKFYLWDWKSKWHLFLWQVEQYKSFAIINCSTCLYVWDCYILCSVLIVLLLSFFLFSSFQDGGSGEVNKVPIEREERRLTVFGQKIIETFVLSHIFRYDVYLFSSSSYPHVIDLLSSCSINFRLFFFIKECSYSSLP